VIDVRDDREIANAGWIHWQWSVVRSQLSVVS
jgi:hypothetical protein